MRFRKDHPVISIINSVVVDLPSPASISYMWNFGSLLGLMLAIQIITGIFLSMHYCADGNLAFASVSHILKDVNYGSLLKYMHANGASFFFIFVYLHIGRGLYYGSYLKHLVWNVGVIIYILMMATAFIGYVLPWGQMSFWGATVITNLVSAVPYVGTSIVEWLWGGYSVGAPTLNRFFSLHYLLPFILAALAAVHIIGLHTAGSNNPLGLNPDVDKIHFHSYFTSKDLVTLILAFILLLAISIYAPNLLGDVENFIPADSLKTPEHIQPEWYFLFAYAILRSIPNKLGGVIAMFSALLILLVIPLIHTSRQKGLTFRPIGKTLYWLIITNFFLLTWIGAKPVEDPYILVGQVATFLYFLYPLILMPSIELLENKLLTNK